MKLDPIPKTVVRQTLLSRKPRPASALVATFGTACLFVVSGHFASNPWALAAEPGRVFSMHQLWRLFTAMLVHSNLAHLVANSLPWWGFSFLLYGYFGPWIFPVGVLLGGTLVNALAIATYPPGTELLGASGAVYLMAGFWLVLCPLIDRRYRVGRRLLHASGFALALLAPQSLDPATSYRTHAIGFIIGGIGGAVFFRCRRETIRQAETVQLESSFDEDFT